MSVTSCSPLPRVRVEVPAAPVPVDEPRRPLLGRLVAAASRLDDLVLGTRRSHLRARLAMALRVAWPWTLLYLAPGLALLLAARGA